MNEIGELIRIQRVIKGYSQEYIANQLNMSQSAYSNMERGNTEISARRLCQIADLLEVPPLALLPKSKYGSHINLLSLKTEIHRLRTLWHRVFRKKKSLHKAALLHADNDIPKSLT
ncbi:MAG: helix-turn-helix domain-containing protein [Mucilaginibacter sp.]